MIKDEEFIDTDFSGCMKEKIIKALTEGVYYDSIDVSDLIIKSDKYVYEYSDKCPDIKEYVKAWAFTYNYGNTAPDEFYENSEAGGYDFLSMWNCSKNVTDFMDMITNHENYDVTRIKEIKETKIKTSNDVEFFIHAVSQMKSWDNVPDEAWKNACEVVGVQPEDTESETFEAIVSEIHIVL